MFINDTHESHTLWTLAVRYGVAVLVVCLAGGITLVLPPVATGTPFLFFFAAVMLSAWYGGFGPALLTLLLAAVWSAYFLLPVQPLGEAGPHADLLRVSLFMGVAFLISALYTRQQRTAAAERFQREYCQTTLASIGDAVIVTDTQGNVTTMNPVAQRLTGWSFDAAQGNALADVFVIVNEETRQPVEDPVRKVLRTGAVAYLANHTALCPKQGPEIPIDDSAAPIRDVQGRLLGSVVVFRDITAWRQAEAASLRLAAIVESSDDAIISISLEGVVTSWNVAAERVFGYRREKMIGQSTLRLLPEDRQDEERLILERLRRGERVKHFETVRRSKDGRLLDMSITASPLQDAQGLLIGVSKIARDITERKRAEEALRQAKDELEFRVTERTAELQVAKEQAEAANRAKSEFLANMSHELRTPLNAIIGFTGTLLMKLPGPLTVDQDKQLRTVQGSGKHLLSLINDLLDMAKIEAGKMELILAPVVLQDVVHEVATALRPLAEAKGVAFKLTIPDLDLVSQTDRRALSQILLNLTTNAIKFTEQGQVGLELRQYQTDGQLRTEIRVRDTGIGIRPEEQSKLFSAFTQVDASTKRRYEGTGLGLHLSQQLAELLGKQITFESEYGKGSTFTVVWTEN